MATIAIFPVSLVREVLKNGTGGFDEKLCKKFGHSRQSRMTGAVVSHGGVINTIVGNMKPDSFVGYSYTPRGKRFEYTEGMYYVMPKS